MKKLADKVRNYTDKELTSLERRIKKHYKDAQSDLNKKWETYMANGEKRLNSLENAFKTAQGEAKEKAKEEYQKALRNYTLRNKWYQNMVDETAERISKANEIAVNYANNKVADIYLANYNSISGAYEELGMDFTIMNEDMLKNVMTEKDLRLPKKKLDKNKDKKWNIKKINSSMTQGILQGESIKKIAKRLLPIVDMNKASAVRTARTLITEAENRGRLDSYKDIEERGAVIKKVWIATGDDRTRDWHIVMDGQEVDTDEPFVDGNGNELDYPADPNGAPETVYNCRCSMTTHIVGIKGLNGEINAVDIKPQSELHTQQIKEQREQRDKQNKETGILEVWKNGKKIGEIATMGDKVGKDNGNRNR